MYRACRFRFKVLGLIGFRVYRGPEKTSEPPRRDLGIGHIPDTTLYTSHNSRGTRNFWRPLLQPS